MKNKRESFFWASYSDLMTSLFFVMMLLFVLTLAVQSKQNAATRAELEKIKEIERATHNIDENYFEYKPELKKHKLKIEVKFPLQSASLANIDRDQKIELVAAGNAIKKFVENHQEENVEYFLIIEGQASKDAMGYFTSNYELSYERALALKHFWEQNDVHFAQNCEVLICGSGDGVLSGTDKYRDPIQALNQRFLIYLIPKIGTIVK